MRKNLVWITCLFCLFLSGCETFRFAPGEAQKQNAWLHNRTAMLTAQAACDENSSEQLQALTKLSELQSRAFTSYYGLPKQFPHAESVEDILSESNIALTNTALMESADRPDLWQAADNGLELAIGIFALFGGVYGTKAVSFLKQAKTKSTALKEIINGNDLFKKQNAESAQAFKQSHASQSPQTRQLVAQMKN
jgi:hypothetical protein